MCPEFWVHIRNVRRIEPVFLFRQLRGRRHTLVHRNLEYQLLAGEAVGFVGLCHGLGFRVRCRDVGHVLMGARPQPSVLHVEPLVVDGVLPPVDVIL